MRFGAENNALLSAKAGNDAQFAMSETSDFIVSNRISGQASVFAGSVSGSTPPLSSLYYLRPMDAYISLDASHKQSDDAHLRLNAHYAYGFGTYEYATRSDYYAGEEILTLQEHFAPSSTLHVPSIGIEYQINADDRFLNERFRATANFVTDALATGRDGEVLDQHSRARTIQLQNSLDWRKLIGNRRVSFNNTVIQQYCGVDDNAFRTVLLCGTGSGRTAERQQPPSADETKHSLRSRLASVNHRFAAGCYPGLRFHRQSTGIR